MLVVFTLDKRLELPRGFLDRYGEPLQRQRVIEALFRQEGYTRGYSEVETPILERAEALPSEFFAVWNERNFLPVTLKDYNGEGKELATTRAMLRPEGTLPVCRFLATQLAQGKSMLPAKLIYAIDCYRNEPVENIEGNRLRQFNQLGVECIGDASQEGDKEVILYAYEVLRKIGLPREDIRIRMSNVSYIKDLFDKSRFSREKRSGLQDVVDKFSKSRAEGKTSTTSLPYVKKLNKPLQLRWKSLVDTYGTPSNQMSGLGEDFQNLIQEIRRDGVPAIVDTSVVRGYLYYTGPVFQIDARKQDGNWVAEIGGGGRYDKLIGKNLQTFGIERNVPATGFAFGTERLVDVSRLPKGKYQIKMVI